MRKIVVIASLTLIMAAGIASGQEKAGGYKGIGARIGYVAPPSDGWEGTVGFDVLGDLRIKPNVMIEPGVRYFSAEPKQTISLDGSFKDFQIFANAKYLLGKPKSSFEPYLGAGVGLHFVTVKNAGFADVDETKFGLNLVGGGYFNVSPSIKLNVEAGYAIVSDMNHFTLMAGAVFALGG